MADLTTSVQFIKGIGPQKAKALEKLGILTLRDLIGYFPRRYEDRRETRRIAQLQDGESACVAVSAADEIAVAQFIAGKIGFTDIEKYVEKGLSFIRGNKVSSVDEVLSIDETVKKYIRQTMR